MRVFSTVDWLSMWEAGLKQKPALWALILLTFVHPDLPVDTLAQFSIGQRDEYLLILREMLFGSRVVSLTECPKCNTHLESEFELKDICTTSQTKTNEVRDMSMDEWQIHFHLPNSVDLLEINGLQESGTAYQTLYQRCIEKAEQNGEAILVDQLPDEVKNAVITQMAQLDSQGDVQIMLTCPTCTHQWLTTLDIVRFFWSELDAWAIRILHDVHSLASAYGWREADILAMSPWRRQVYLELIE